MSLPQVTAAQWTSRSEVRREDDDELLGFVMHGPQGVVPSTIFGSALGQHQDDEDTARSVVEALGLDPLTDRWMLRRDDGDLQVRIVEASPSQVVVQNDDYGSGMDLNVRFTLETPTSDQLRRS